MVKSPQRPESVTGAEHPANDESSRAAGSDEAQNATTTINSPSQHDFEDPPTEHHGPARNPQRHGSYDSNIHLPPDFKPWLTGDPYHHYIPKKEDPWQECFKLVLKFDDEMCRGWREEIDTLLVFAGLFSAAVTAFTVESYRWLQDNADDIQVQLLQQISSQVGSLQSNRSQPTLANNSPSTFLPEPSSVRINMCWFTSLTLSLTAVLVGILCKQWLREYQRYEGLSAKDALPVRQLRYEGLLGWHVPKILSALPLLLQAALVLFLSGLLDLLWTMNAQVASVVTVVVGIAMVFLMATTIIPCIQHLAHLSKVWTVGDREPGPQCAFKSPQAWAFHLLITKVFSLYSGIKRSLFYGTVANYLQAQLDSWHSDDANWLTYDQRWRIHGRFIERGINWFDKTFARGNSNVEAINNVYHCLESLEPHISAACVSQIIDENWDPLVPLVGLVQPALENFQMQPMDEDVPEAFSNDMILSSYLVVHYKADSRIAFRCMEHCARMLNSSALNTGFTAIILEVLKVATSPTSTNPSDCERTVIFVVVVWKVPNHISVLQVLVTQLLTAFKRLFASNLLSIDEIPTLWSVVLRMAKQNELPAGSSSVPLTSIRALLKHVERWLARVVDSPHLTTADKQYIVTRCSIGISTIRDMFSPPHEDNQLDIEDDSDLDEQTFSLFQEVLDRMLTSLGGSYSTLQPLIGSENWATATPELY
ncbi:hypothetical protein NLJ89_g9261 [Agrocybe chaxingu]|uniref:DUF6535 domain-containing protein n=1 Tax=Agrocybe chaxingu TaxID=84603 RepID=A0A9W8K0X4_9AGAR|nr:hypothetical protein NLJ89_g9261 [Agrocybe chaxingu]